jgi:hypothetical protein
VITFLLKADYELNEKAFICTIWHSGNWHYIFREYVPFEEDHCLCMCVCACACVWILFSVRKIKAAYQCKIDKFTASISTLKQGLNILLDWCLGQLDPEAYRVKMFSVQACHFDAACPCEIVECGFILTEWRIFSKKTSNLLIISSRFCKRWEIYWLADLLHGVS